MTELQLQATALFCVQTANVGCGSWKLQPDRSGLRSGNAGHRMESILQRIRRWFYQRRAQRRDNKAMKNPKPQIISRREYTPILSAVERCAYAAAHRLCAEDLDNRELICPGGQRSARVDAIARIIMESFEGTIDEKQGS